RHRQRGGGRAVALWCPPRRHAAHPVPRLGRDARRATATDLGLRSPVTDIAERARTLTLQRRPFVHATVVRAQEPTSARAGDAAVILDDGSIEGFVGGQCGEGSGRRAALETLRDARTRLRRVLPDGAAEFPEAPGAQVVVNPCLSGGAIEIFLRPMLPRPLLGVAGAGTPVGAAGARR